MVVTNGEYGIRRSQFHYGEWKYLLIKQYLFRRVWWLGYFITRTLLKKLPRIKWNRVSVLWTCVCFLCKSRLVISGHLCEKVAQKNDQSHSMNNPPLRVVDLVTVVIDLWLGVTLPNVKVIKCGQSILNRNNQLWSKTPKLPKIGQNCLFLEESKFWHFVWCVHIKRTDSSGF